MKSLWERHRPLFLLVIILLVDLVWLSHQQRYPDHSTLLERVVYRVSAPVILATTATFRGIGEWWHGYVDLRGVREENAALRRALRDRDRRLTETAELRAAHERLSRLLALKEARPGRAVAAQVRFFQVGEAAATLVVNRGRRDGIRPDAPVVAPAGLVGKVVAASPRTAKVLLITDPSSGVAVMIQRHRRYLEGVAIGTGGGGLFVKYITTLADVGEGDVVIASGLDGIYPKGTPVGTVVAVGAGVEYQREIRVRPRVEFGRLEEVLILLPAEAPPPAEAEAPPAPAPPPAAAPPLGTAEAGP